MQLVIQLHENLAVCVAKRISAKNFNSQASPVDWADC